MLRWALLLGLLPLAASAQALLPDAPPGAARPTQPQQGNPFQAPPPGSALPALPGPPPALHQGLPPNMLTPWDSLPRKKPQPLTMRDGQVVPAPARPYVPPFKWDVPETIDEVTVPGKMSTEGIPVSFRAVRTRMKLDALLKYMITRFEESHLWVPKASEQFQLPRVPQLTAYDSDSKISYTAIFQGNRDGTLTVILGEAYMADWKQPTEPGFAPVYPGAAELVRSKVEGQELFTFTTSASAAEVTRFYRDMLTKGGARREAEAGVYMGPNDSISVSARPIQGRTIVSVSKRAPTAETTSAPPHGK